MGGEGDQLGIVQEIRTWPYDQVVYSQPGIRPRDWDVQSSLGFSDTNRSPNPGQTTRLTIVNKRQENLRNNEFDGPDRRQSKIKRKRKVISTKTFPEN